MVLHPPWSVRRTIPTGSRRNAILPRRIATSVLISLAIRPAVISISIVPIIASAMISVSVVPITLVGSIISIICKRQDVPMYGAVTLTARAASTVSRRLCPSSFLLCQLIELVPFLLVLHLLHLLLFDFGTTLFKCELSSLFFREEFGLFK